MPSSQKEPKNIPISISILHEQEYNNLCLLVTPTKFKKRRAFSERSTEKLYNSLNELLSVQFYDKRRKTLKK